MSTPVHWQAPGEFNTDFDDWYESRIEVDPPNNRTSRTRSTTLYQDYKNWAGINQRYHMTHIEFGIRLARVHPMKVKNHRGQTIYAGISLKPGEPEIYDISKRPKEPTFAG